MKKAVLSFVFVALSVMAFAQQWTSIGNSAATEPTSPVVKLISSSEQQVVVDFSLSGFGMTRVSTPKGIQQVVSVPKMATMLEAGAPDLPQFPIPAIIGDLAEMEVSLINSDFTDYQDIEIAPSKGNFSRQIDPKDVPYTYGAMYNENAFYPGMQAHLEVPYILRDFRGQNIMVTPFAYNPVTKTLRVYHHLILAMNKVSDNGENPKLNRKKGALRVDPEMRQSYQHRFINFGVGEAKYNFVIDRGEMLVICADQFMEGMQSFVDWKNQSGRPTTMVSVTEAGGNNDTQIKNYIQSIYNDPNHNLRFVLFVGDYDHITPHAVGAERSDNWFGQLEGNDHYDDILIGRFSVQNDAHLANHVNKVLYYERDLDETATWGNKGLGIGYIGAGTGHYGEDDYEHIDFIRDTLEHYTYEHVTELHGGGGGASTASISNTINEGVSIINYCNHGSETSWGVANYNTSDVNALVNDNKWPVVWSVACLCGKFNYGGANGECFAEAWMRATDNTTGVPTGAIAGMFSWMEQPWIPPMYGQDEMVDILAEWHNSDKYNHTMGGASLNGNLNVMDMSGSSGNDTHDTWILFGDPSLMVRTDIPADMNVSCNPPVLMLSMSNLEVMAENTPFGIATLMMDGEVLASSYIYNNVAELNFPPMNNVGVATLTVIGYNKKTEMLPVEVLPAEGAYLSINSYTPSFAPVNTEVSMSMNFKNVGMDPTNGTTTITLTCDDNRLEIINGTAELGVVAPNEIATLENAFRYIVAENVEDGTRFRIDVTMTCGNDVWNGIVYITASQAILNYVGTSWAGSFVPGETVTLVANFKNTGHYMASNAVSTIQCNNAHVTLLNPTVEVGTIDPDGIAACVFEIAIDSLCPETEQILVEFMLNADGGLQAEGNVTLKNACNVIFDLTDRWGDGWNGNKLVVSFSDGSPTQELTIEDGSAASYTLSIGNGVTVTLGWINGNYSYECSFVVRYEDGDVIYNGSAGVNYQFVCNCAGGDPIGSLNPVTDLTIQVNDPFIELNWTATPDAIGYIIYRNGIEIAQTTDSYYSEETDQAIFYTYCVVAQYESGNSTPECVIADLTDIDENVSELSIYPNPTNDILYINNGNSEFSYVMYNSLGQAVVNGNSQGAEQISVDGMEKGIYFLRITTGTQVRLEKVVVK